MLKIEDTKPKGAIMINRGQNTATFGAASLTFNEVDHTFNHAGDIFGGADRISDIGPNFKANAVVDVKPRILGIKNL